MQPGGVVVSIPLGTASVPETPPASLRESRDLVHCHPRLRGVYPLIQADFKAATGMELFPTHTYRSPDVQFDLFRKGRRQLEGGLWVPEYPDGRGIVTNCDGTKMKSRHNLYPARAIDSCVDTDPGPGKVAGWDEKLYLPLGPICARYGVIWAPRLSARTRDLPHIELGPEVP